MENAPLPDEDNKCPTCGSELKSCKGMVGEDVLYCSKHCGYVWTDNEQALAIVI